MSIETLQKAAETRRTIYALNKHLPISQDEVQRIVEHAIQHTPSSFNSQSSRVLLLLGAEHEKLWDITASQLRKIVPAEQFGPTEAKLQAFAAGAGTVLFFEDQKVVEQLQEKFALYAQNFPVWSEHASAMLQYVIWTTFAAAGVGASLQHYNPVIDAEVQQTWQIPDNWKLRAQLVFGGVAQPAGDKSFMPMDERLKVAGKS